MPRRLPNSPAGYPGFIGKIDEEIEVKYDNAGFYGIKCSPHYAQGMIMLIKVGDAVLPDSYRAFKALVLPISVFRKFIPASINSNAVTKGE